MKSICCICGRKFEGYGNNAEPVKEGLCCDSCNWRVVIPARLTLMNSKWDIENEENNEEE